MLLLFSSCRYCYIRGYESLVLDLIFVRLLGLLCITIFFFCVVLSFVYNLLSFRNHRRWSGWVGVRCVPGCVCTIQDEKERWRKLLSGGTKTVQWWISETQGTEGVLRVVQQIFQILAEILASPSSFSTHGFCSVAFFFGFKGLLLDLIYGESLQRAYPQHSSASMKKAFILFTHQLKTPHCHSAHLDFTGWRYLQRNPSSAERK